MKFFNQLSDILSANAAEFAGTDKRTQKTLDKIIDEVEGRVSVARNNLIAALSDLKRQEKEVDVLQHSAMLWKQKAVEALEKNLEDLARKALVKKKELEEELSCLSGELENMRIVTDKLKTNFKLLESKLSEFKRIRDQLRVKKRAAETQNHLDITVKKMAKSSKTYKTIQKIKAKIRKMDTETESAKNEIDTSTTTDWQAVQTASDAHSPEIDEELAQLKKEIAKH